MSEEWINCDIVPSGEKSVVQKSLRKKLASIPPARLTSWLKEF